MEQCGELLPLPFPRRLAHTREALGHAFSAQRRRRVCSPDVLLGPRSSLPGLRRNLRFVVRLAHRYYAAVRLLLCVHVRLAAMGLRGPACRQRRRTGGLPVLMHIVSRRARGLRLRRILFRLAIYGGIDVAFPIDKQGRHPGLGFRSSIARPTDASVYAWTAPSRGSGWFATPFLWDSCIPDYMLFSPGALIVPVPPTTARRDLGGRSNLASRRAPTRITSSRLRSHAP